MSSLIQMNKMIKTPIYFTVISECPLGWHFSLPLLDWGKMLNVKCYSISWTSSTSPPAPFPSRESSMEPSSEDSLPKGRKRHQSVTIKYPSGMHSHIQNLMLSCSTQQTNLMSLSLLWIHVMHQCHQPENRNKNICSKKASKYQFWCQIEYVKQSWINIS